MSEAHVGDDRLIAHVLDELDGEERSRVAAHLSRCEACHASAEALARTLETYGRADRRDAPPGILVGLLEAQAAARFRRPFRHFLFGMRPVPAIAVAAALVAIFVSGFWIGRRTAPEPVASEPTPSAHVAVARPLPEPPRLAFQPVFPTD
jgi:anti-sigma factor RsiW